MTYGQYKDIIPEVARRQELPHISVAEWMQGMTSPFAWDDPYWTAKRVKLVRPNSKYL